MQTEPDAAGLSVPRPARSFKIARSALVASAGLIRLPILTVLQAVPSSPQHARQRGARLAVACHQPPPSTRRASCIRSP